MYTSRILGGTIAQSTDIKDGRENSIVRVGHKCTECRFGAHIYHLAIHP